MPDKFEGTYQELQDKVNATGISGTWRDLENDKKQYRAENGVKISWWEESKTISFQGNPVRAAEFKAIFNSDNVASVGTPVATKVVPQTNGRPRIFIVHGHDRGSLEQLELILRRLRLDPYILQNNDGQSRTLIEALERQIYEETAFGIVLMTPDDFGYPKEQAEEIKPRARQNVILEMGMVMASLGREKTVILKKGNIEIPSDVNGVIYLEFNDHVREVAVRLAHQMQGAGIEIQENLITLAAT